MPRTLKARPETRRPASRHVLMASAAALAVWLASGAPVVADQARTPYVKARDPLAAGRYLVLIGGCNDCHTPGYAERGGRLPMSRWLTGNPVGFRGPWGTTYPSNLRLTVQTLSERQWVEMAHTRNGYPPMPWRALDRMSEPDLRAIYRFIRSLGPAGVAAPARLAPGVEPRTAYIPFVPQAGGLVRANAGDKAR